jgi:hypothetical protein
MASSSVPAAAPVARAMRALSERRGKRAFHPHGVGFAAVLRPTGPGGHGAAALEREADAVVRLSRSLGLPEWLPDPCGLGLRIPDAHGPARHQDLLLASSGAAPVARHAVLPARGFGDRPYSTLLPYRLGGRLVVICARAVTTDGPGPLLRELRTRGVGGLEFELAIAGPRGPRATVARLTLGERVADEEIERLELNPANTGGGLELAGFINRLRVPSYRSSQLGRRAS